MPEQEKRYKERYDLELPFTVTWKDGSGRTREASGTTKNVSPSGAYLVCDSPVEEGCVVDIRFDKPPAFGGFSPSRVSATGTVIEDVSGIDHAAVYGHRVKFYHFSFSRL